MADEDVRILFGADTSGAQSGIQSVSNELQNMQGPAEALNSSFEELKRTLIAAFSVEAIEGLVEKMAALGTEIEALEVKLNMSGQQVQEWSGAMKTTGGSVESMSRSMTILQKNIDAAIEGPGRQRDAFAALGITTDQLKQHYGDLNTTSLLVADGFQKLHEGGGGISELYATMGRGAASLAPLFAKGAEATQELLDKFAQFTISDTVVDKLHDIHEESTLMGAALQQAGASIVSTFKPAIDAVLGLIIDLASEISQVTSQNDLLSAGIAALTTIFDGLRVGILSVVTGLREVGLAALAAYQALTLHFSDADATWKQLGVVADDYAKKMDNITNSVNKMWAAQEKGAASAKTGTGQGYKALTDKNGSDEEDVSFDRQDIADKLALDKIYLEDRKVIDQQLVASGKISKQESLDDEKTYIADKYQLELSALQEEAGLFKQGSQEYQKVLDQQQQLTATYHLQQDQLALKSIQTQQAEYHQFFQSVNQAFGQMVQGILQGTQTWQQALGRMFDNLLAQFINDFVIKKVTAWVESEVTMTSATVAGATARTTATTAAAAAGSAVSVATSKGQVTNAAATAASNTYSSVSAIPLIGWILAPPAAAVAFGAVEAFGSDIASFAVGSYNVPNDMLAQIHQGEMIIPKTFADSLRQGDGAGLGNGGGQNYNVTINAVDAQSVSNLLRNNAGVIADITKRNVRNFNTSTQQVSRT